MIERCVCGALAWQDSGVLVWVCGICGLVEGSRDADYAALVAAAWPPSGATVTPARRLLHGTAPARVKAALAAASDGLTLMALVYQTDLGQEDVYALLEAGMRQRRILARLPASKMSQDEKIAGAVRYLWAA